MTDDTQKKGYDPAQTSPAEGQSHAIPNEARGENPGTDPADKDQPAEGGRDEAGGEGADRSSAARD
ncbi:hypothetical protein F8S09_10305 [Deinococcus sp. SDU3-2]|uniref:Uncharacterized protein n=1 Tax=Deinococcus terrestris TaxID=2651870 RepID=A0A7X1TRR6_9DEIO|nr:hypothetical protein [Deinococcus terrestris]MPY67078.1 hypothetical protein [Deinococcus terrestris]